jgi:glycosyltransferase involved in cell wall biosynthesis
MNLPKISIVSPSFNQGKFIEENIRSVLNQRYPDVEHLIIDGGSTDQTVDILKRYPHLRWVSEPDRGQTHALNKGFKMATGEIIGWLNSDDTYCDDVFQTIAEKFSNSKVMVVCGDGFETGERSEHLRPLLSRNASPDVLIPYWKWKYEFLQPSFFFRRRVFEEAGYLDEGLHYAMDYDFFIRLGLRYQFHYLPMPIANLRLHGESKTGMNIRKIIPGYIKEMHTVSRRYWGTPAETSYYRYTFSFLSAILFSVCKNIFFVSGSKSRMVLRRIFQKERRAAS